MLKFTLKCNSYDSGILTQYAIAFKSIYSLCVEYTNSYYKEHHKRPGVPNQLKWLNSGTDADWVSRVPKDIVMQAITTVRDDFRSVDRGFKKSVNTLHADKSLFFRLSSVTCYDNAVKIGGRRIYINNPTHFQGLVKNAVIRQVGSSWVLSGNLQFRKKVTSNVKKATQRA